MAASKRPSEPAAAKRKPAPETRASKRSAHLTIDNEAVELPLVSGTLGPAVIDVGSLTAKGYFTFDPGFVSTASCESAITYIDGDAGVLLHRGYPIEELAEHSDHLEVGYLLVNGEWPNRWQQDELLHTS